MMETSQQADAEEMPNVKKPRKRFKKLFSQIQYQMEFYFSDANLNKDRFMTKIVAESETGMIPLDVFMKFNRVKSLCTDEEMLAKALRKSKMLEITNNCVKRKVPYKPRDKSDVDDRTIYVECLPPHTDHEMLKKLFSVYGNVLFVSLPKYKTSGDLKNFAFIEFETKEEASKAVNMMNTCDADKAGRFPKMHNKQWQSLQKQVDTRTITDETESSKTGKKKRRHPSGESSDGEDGSSAQKKRNLSSEGEDHGGEILSGGTKKRKREASECSEGDGSHTGVQKKGGKDRRRSKEKLMKKGENESDSDGKLNCPKKVKQETKSGVSETDAEAKGMKGTVDSDVEKAEIKGPMKGILKQESREDDAKAKKRKLEDGGSDSDAKRVKIGENVVTHSITDKRKRRHPNRNQRRHEKETDVHMRVLSKKHWLDLKKEYLQLQKESMKALKKSVQEKKATTSCIKSESEKDGESKAEKDGKAKPAIEFAPNVIVHVKVDPLRMPMTRQQIKERLNPDAIAYVDMNDGDQEGHVRCKSEDAAKLMTDAKVDGFNVSLLQGGEEKLYWEKITADREQKLNSKRRKKRGAQKVVEKIDRIVADVSKQKHVFFDE